jgi:hypothetical protein
MPAGVITNTQGEASFCVEDLVSETLEGSSKRLSILPEPLLNQALHDYVHKQCGSAINEGVETTLKNTQSKLNKEKRVGSNVEDIHKKISSETEKARVESDLGRGRRVKDEKEEDDDMGKQEDQGMGDADGDAYVSEEKRSSSRNETSGDEGFSEEEYVSKKKVPDKKRGRQAANTQPKPKPKPKPSQSSRGGGSALSNLVKARGSKASQKSAARSSQASTAMGTQRSQRTQRTQIGLDSDDDDDDEAAWGEQGSSAKAEFDDDEFEDEYADLGSDDNVDIEELSGDSDSDESPVKKKPKGRKPMKSVVQSSARGVKAAKSSKKTPARGSQSQLQFKKVGNDDDEFQSQRARKPRNVFDVDDEDDDDDVEEMPRPSSKSQRNWGKAKR